MYNLLNNADARKYAILSVMTLLCSLTVTVITVSSTKSFFKSHPILSIAVLFLAIPLTVINVKSKSMFGVFISGTLMFVAFGAGIASWVDSINPNTLSFATYVTIGATVLFGAVGIMYPKSLQHLGKLLFLALVGYLVALVVSLFFAVAFGISFSWLGAIGALIFSGILVYEFNGFRDLDSTLDAAKLGFSIGVTVLNLFMSLVNLDNE